MCTPWAGATCPARSVPHIPHQQSRPIGSCPESISSRGHGQPDSMIKGVKSILGAVRGVAQQVPTRWTGDSGATAQDMA
eukprot:scaffold57280_cov22-Tisochrysis_lutea.AAC.1